DQEGPAADTQEESQEDCPVQRSTAIEETPRTLKHFPVRPETISHMEYSRLDRTMTVVDTTGYIRIYEGVPAEVCKRMFACEDNSHALQELGASHDVLIKRANYIMTRPLPQLEAAISCAMERLVPVKGCWVSRRDVDPNLGCVIDLRK